jgi:hypothetical protein
VVLPDNPELFWSQLSYSVLIAQLFWSQLCYSGLNSGISFLDEVFYFVARSTLALFFISGEADDLNAGQIGFLISYHYMVFQRYQGPPAKYPCAYMYGRTTIEISGNEHGILWPCT